LRIGLGVTEQPGGERGRQHDEGEDAAATILVGPHAKGQTNQRSGQDRRADEQAELRFAEAEILLYLNADDRKNRPHRETQGEGNGGNPERTSLRAAIL
jgi:hypothetical protein